MAETIRGGAYRAADGSWHDAKGKPLSSKQVQEFKDLKAGQADEAKASVTPNSVTAVTESKPERRRTGRNKKTDTEGGE